MVQAKALTSMGKLLRKQAGVPEGGFSSANDGASQRAMRCCRLEGGWLAWSEQPFQPTQTAEPVNPLARARKVYQIRRFCDFPLSGKAQRDTLNQLPNANKNDWFSVAQRRAKD